MAINQNKGLAKQELKPSVTSEENGLEKALQEPKLCQLHDLEPLREALRLAMLMVGLRAANIPKNEEKAVLMAYIIENYGGHTASEIKLAFKMAVAGSLDLESSEVVCYENFSVLYFSTIMNAYRRWSKEAFFQVAKEQPKQIEYKSDISDEDFILAVRMVFNSSGKWQSIPALAYDVLTRQGELMLSVSDKKEIMALMNKMFTELDDSAKVDFAKSYIVGKYFESKSA